MKYRIAYGFGAFVLLALWVNALVNPIPPAMTGNASYDAGDQVGGWLFSGFLAFAGLSCLYKAIRGPKKSRTTTEQ